MSKELMKIPGRNYEIEPEPIFIPKKHRNYFEPVGTPHKRVFKKGRRIKTMAALDKHLSSGGWIFWGQQKRAVHPGWVMSWQYNMVRNSLGRMCKAVRI